MPVTCFVPSSTSPAQITCSRPWSPRALKLVIVTDPRFSVDDVYGSAPIPSLRSPLARSVPPANVSRSVLFAAPSPIVILKLRPSSPCAPVGFASAGAATSESSSIGIKRRMRIY